ncbi:hypothetical protein ACERK3_04460 [Phycisphaerales bacterium AB-hyl4]|uniref:Uncharacterized protein n=1 Tax=Natronomicrosphaera hydrolytica TaxID=3242702 RepID=A0ABV4U3R0_9BACT
MQFSKMTKFMGSATLALGMTLGFSAADADAATVLRMDINNVVADWDGVAGDSFGSSASGILSLSFGNLTNLDSIQINSVEQVGLTGIQDFVGSIVINNGYVVDGGFTVTDLSSNTYSADFVNGQVFNIGGDVGPFLVSGGTNNGVFSGSSFAGIDVSQWFTPGEAYNGLYTEFRYDGNSIDNSTEFHASVVVPTPAAALAGLPMLGVLGLGYMIRRRRLAAA